MIAYMAAIITALYPVIAHKLGLEHEKEAVLYVDSELYCSRGMLSAMKGLKEQGIFKDVVVCQLLCPNDLFLEVSSDEMVEIRIVEHYDNLFKEKGYEISKFDKIFVTNDIWGGDVNLYFNLRKINYIWLQIAFNVLPGINTKIDGNLKEGLAHSYDKYKALSPLAECAEACLMTTSEKSINYFREKGKKFITWDRDGCFNNICLQDLKKLFMAFGLEPCGFEHEILTDKVLMIKNSYEFLRSHGALKWIFGLESYTKDEIYSIMDKVSIDFYAPKAEIIYVKCHIHDFINEAEINRLYGENAVLLPNVPFEILSKYFMLEGMKFSTVIGVGSLSLAAVHSESYDNFFALGLDFIKTWWFYISIYAALLWMKQHGYVEIFCDAVLKSQIEFMSVQMKYSVKAVEFKAADVKKICNSVIMIDSCNYPNGNILNSLHGSSAAAILNMELSTWDITSSAEFFSPIYIKKEKLQEPECDILFRDEKVWVYAKDKTIRKEVRDFAFERNFSELGLKAYAQKITLSYALDMFQQMQDKYENKILREKVNRLSRKADMLTNIFAMSTDNPILISVMAKEIIDIYSYLDFLKIVGSKYMLILAVRDTPGSCIPDNVLEKIHELGFTGFSRELWRMYIGISNKAHVFCDRAGEKREDAVNYDCAAPWQEVELSISSMAWRQGNKAKIMINGTDYAVNLRGINIVVYDIENKRLVDSIGFDAHTAQWEFVRKS